MADNCDAVALADLNDPSSVLKAFAEADVLGRDRFLEKYGFGPSRAYFAEFGGKRYDSKAIVGAAYGFQFPALGTPNRSRLFGREANRSTAI